MFGGCDRISIRGIHHHDTLCRRRWNIDIVNANASPADDLQIGGRGKNVCRHPGRRADGKPVIFTDDVSQLIRAEAGLYIHLNAPFPQNFCGTRAQFVTYQ